MNPEALKGHLDLLLLTALKGRPAHGYAVLERLREHRREVFDLPEGTIYPALHRLEEAGLLASRWSDASGRRRRVYQLTPKGLRSLEKRREQWQVFAQGIEAVLDLGAGA
jgi:DNA-binding PadR family transcriptional regulator